jgi:beta-galactosidase
VHYWRLPRNVWKTALESLKTLGATMVDTYVPWAIHETAQGTYDFGKGNPRLDVVEFLSIAHELGLSAIVRPGPHINAELTGFGIPERVLWDPACQAHSPSGAPVILPSPPLAFPVPSYASRAFHAEAETWLTAVATLLAPLVYPAGPIVLCQIDNEGALYFRDGPYDQDYHPDAVEQYRRFLRQRYPTPTSLRAAYGQAALPYDEMTPPTKLDARDVNGLARHLDWAEYQEALVESALYRFKKTLAKGGLDGVPTMHNLPIADYATPLDPARIERTVDFVALDYYHHASERIRAEIARRTSNLAVRSVARKVPAFAAEMGAGFAPYFPPISEADNAFSVLAALAYGLRGFNLYMAVSRDRWVGGPIDERGRARPSSAFWSSLIAAMKRTRFHELVRQAPVRIVVPRSYHRLVRVCHAFGPVPPAAFAFAGESAERGALEGPLDPTEGATLEAEQFLHTLERILERERVAFAVVGAELLDDGLANAAWTIVVSPGALPEEMTRKIADRMLTAGHVSVGPRMPERDATLRPSPTRLPNIERPAAPILLPRGPATLAEIVHTTLDDLGVPRGPHAVVEGGSNAGIFTTVHEDAEGRPRVLFVINSGEAETTANIALPRAAAASDALSGYGVPVEDGHVVVTVGPLSVRMLELVPRASA